MKAFKPILESSKQKFTEIDGDFFALNAIKNNKWKRTNRLNKRTVSCFVERGFHHELCQKPDLHKPDDTCRTRGKL